jgi:hypothetical protein
MKKTLLILFFIAGISGIASSQMFRFGIKGGLNFSKLAFEDVTDVISGGTTYSLTQDESFMGYHIGLMARIKIPIFYIQPELLFNTSGGNVFVEGTGQNPIEQVKQVKYNKIDLPVLLGTNLGPLRINAGLVATYVLSTDSELKDVIPELETAYNSATFGYQAGIGFDFLKRLTLDGRYEGSLSNLTDKITVAGTDYPVDAREPKWIISLGILF